MSEAITIKINDKPYTLRMSDCTALDAQACRQQTGLSLRGILNAASEDPDLDIIATIVWLARRQAGEKVTFEMVAGEIGYDAEILPVVADPVEDDSPEV